MGEYIYEHSRCHDQFGKPLDAPMLTQREEIVRCRDCQHVEHIRCNNPREVWLCNAEWCEGFDEDHPVVEPTGFCKWGEKKTEQDKQSELKPCPFCGGEAAIRYEPSFGVYYAHCDTCGSETGNTGLYRKEDRAIDAWNTRTELTCRQEERGWGTEGDHARVWLDCGHDCMVPTVQDLPNYCPSCGARVVSTLR